MSARNPWENHDPVLARKLSLPAVMNTYTMLFKADSTRRIDSVIDYFGEARPFAAGRKTWLAREAGPQPRRRRREPIRWLAMR